MKPSQMKEKPIVRNEAIAFSLSFSAFFAPLRFKIIKAIALELKPEFGYNQFKVTIQKANTMTSQAVELEGTWEEIVAQSDKLAGCRVRVIVLSDEEKLPSPEESFRQGWYEAMTGQTIPLSELWEGIDAE